MYSDAVGPFEFSASRHHSKFKRTCHSVPLGEKKGLPQLNGQQLPQQSGVVSSIYSFAFCSPMPDSRPAPPPLSSSCLRQNAASKNRVKPRACLKTSPNPGNRPRPTAAPAVATKPSTQELAMKSAKSAFGRTTVKTITMRTKCAEGRTVHSA